MNEEWIKNLKVGDKVCYKTRFMKGCQFTTVKKITPTGKIRLENGGTADDRGRVKGKDVWDSGYNLEPVTKELNDYNRKINLYQMLDEFRFSNLDLETLEKIDKLVNP